MSINRRTFVKGATVTAVGTGLTLSSQPTTAATNRVLGANEKIVVGVIGTDGIGRGNVRDFLRIPEVEVAAVCDVYQGNLDQAVEMTGSKAVDS